MKAIRFMQPEVIEYSDIPAPQVKDNEVLAKIAYAGFCATDIELLTGETPHLTGYTLTRADEGLAVKRRSGLEYLHKAPHYRNKLCEPFFVTADYRPELQDKPIHLSYHAGQELDYILEGRMRFQYEEHTEELGPGDMLLYDSGRGHGMIAIDGAPCKFLAVVLKAKEDII